MIKIKELLKLIRPKHWVKNMLVFAVLIYSGRLFNISDFLVTLLGAAAFCFASSSIYVFNDLKDARQDAEHEIKRSRPIASGAISKGTAIAACCGCIALAIVFLFLSVLRPGILNAGVLKPGDLTAGSTEVLGFGSRIANGAGAFCVIFAYIIINIAYSAGLKKIPIIDISILVAGFLLRLLLGSIIIDQYISSWMILTVVSISFYLSLGKRRGEIIKYAENAENVRHVLKYYTKSFLDKNMYASFTLTLVFYSLWAAGGSELSGLGSSLLVWTIPVVMVIFMKYNLDVEQRDYADPVDVLFSDKILLLLVFVYGLTALGIIYGERLVL